MRRRRLLGIVGASTAALAGCNTIADPGGPDGTPEGTAQDGDPSSQAGSGDGDDQRPSLSDGPSWASVGEWVTAPMGWSVLVSDVAVQPTVALVSPTVDGGFTREVLGSPDGQFVLGTVTIEPATETYIPTPRADAMVTGLLVDGTPVNRRPSRTEGNDDGQRSVRVAHPVPVESAERAALAVRTVQGGAGDWMGANWRLTEGTVADLGARPRFEVGSVETPDSVGTDDVVEVTVDVANTGDRVGRFRAWLTADDWATRLAVAVPLGERVRRTVTTRPRPGREPVRISLDWGTDRVVRTVDRSQ